jgi:hypothetical protein
MLCHWGPNLFDILMACIQQWQRRERPNFGCESKTEPMALKLCEKLFRQKRTFRPGNSWYNIKQ